VTIAFIFPGQGANVDHAVHDWRAGCGAVRELLDVAGREYQPRLTALCLGIERELGTHGIRPDIVAGHSLGEVAACAATGCIRHENAVGVAAVRGRLMAREAERHPGGMLALAVSDRSVAEAAVANARPHGMVSIAAHNAADQWVVSGEWAALRTIAARMDASPVAVAGPWHTEAMADAVDEYRDVLRRAVTMPLRVPLVCNRAGAIVENAHEIPELLASQLTRPVEWVETMMTLDRFGVTDVITVGPAKALRALVRRGLGSHVCVHAVELPDDVARVAQALGR